MNKTRMRNAIHSGIGDRDDLFVKQPKSEEIEEDFQYAARLRGKKRHTASFYPEIPFQYGISYKGKVLETDNKQNYQFHINAHPEKKIEYCIEQTKELPIKRLWEAEACFEAEVLRMRMDYALHWSGKKEIDVQNKVDYAVNWRASVVGKSIADARDFFTSQNGHFIGYGDASTWKKHSSGYIYDYSNISRFSGIIAKQYYGIENYEAEFDFKTVLATNDQHVGGNDDDIVGLIFKAKDSKNFYMMLWEREERVKASWRAPDRLDGFNMLSSGESAWESRVTRDDCKSSSYMTNSEWEDYQNNRGWRNKHRRIYKVTNGIMKRVDRTPGSGSLGYSSSVRDLGDGKGWNLNELHSLKVNSIGKRVEIFTRRNGVWEKIFDFNTDWAEGSFGTVNVSQSVRFYRIQVREKNIINGRIPETGWSSMQQKTKDLGKAYEYCIGDARRVSNKLKDSVPGIDLSTINFLSFGGELRDNSLGKITSPIRENTNIIVTGYTHKEYEPVKGRVPESNWFSFDGIGQYELTDNATKFIRQESDIEDDDAITIEEMTGEVKETSQYYTQPGEVILNGLYGPVIAKSNNAADAGKVYKECFIECGIEDITPDNRDYETGKVVFTDIADVFKKADDHFFSRPDFINKKRNYELLKPVYKNPPLPEGVEASENGCVVELEPEEIEVDMECLNDFDFDGKRLVMWSCEFPIEKETRCFTNSVFAYQGWQTFNPLKEFTPNKWTTYELKPVEATIKVEYDSIEWIGHKKLALAPVGSKIRIQTTEWYRSIFPADIVNIGVVDTRENMVANLPPAPEHYWNPKAMDNPDVVNRMPDHFGTIHYLLDAWDNHPDVVMWYESKPDVTTESIDRSNKAVAGLKNMPILYTAKDNDQLVIHCNENPREVDWTSGKYIGYGKVNGKQPYLSDNKGKADMVNVPTDVVYFPSNIIENSISKPIIDLKLQGPAKEYIKKDLSEPPSIQYELHSNNSLVNFTSNYTSIYTWYTDWFSKWVIDSTMIYSAFKSKKEEITQLMELDPSNPSVSEDYTEDSTIIEETEVMADNPFINIWLENGDRVFAQVKQATPLPWSPMIHNGYYYHKDKENYLYAEKITHTKTPDSNHQINIHPRPQQGAAIIVKDNEGNPLRKVTFYDENWNLTLENKEVFHGNGYAKYFLNYKGIDKNTLTIKINGSLKKKQDYLFNENTSSIEFMEEIMPRDEIEIRYKLLYSYYIDMNPYTNFSIVTKDEAQIVLHDNYDKAKMQDMTIIYETAKETPFYRASEVTTNPLLNHNHTGFLYITEETKQRVKDVDIYLSSSVVSNSGVEKVLVTVKVYDEYDNPCSNKKVTIRRDNRIISGDYRTNESGEVYVMDYPDASTSLLSTYRAESEGKVKEAVLNYYDEEIEGTYYLEMTSDKRSLIAGENDSLDIVVTLYNQFWQTIGKEEEITVSYENTQGDSIVYTSETDDNSQIKIKLLSETEETGNITVKVSYENATNYLHVKLV